MAQVIDKIKSFWIDHSGVSSVEYALIIALVAGGIVLAAVALGVSVAGEFNEATDCIADTTQCD